MAVALILLGFGLLRKSCAAGKGTSVPRSDGGISDMAAASSVGDIQSPWAAEKSDWEHSLPCLLHEIRNYSCTLRGNAQLLRLQVPSAGMLEPLGRLERTTEKIESLARKIMEAASITQVTETHAFGAADLIEGCIGDHFHEARETFHILAEGDIPAIEGDFLKLERVFLNLFRNALEAGARNVTVRLSVSRNRVLIQVEDDGRGCAGEQLDRLFRPLYTTKKDKGGTGLGLYMVRAIMESHGGAISAISKNAWGGMETGMIFGLELPGSGPLKAKVRAGNPDLIWHGQRVM